MLLSVRRRSARCAFLHMLRWQMYYGGLQMKWRCQHTRRKWPEFFYKCCSSETWRLHRSNRRQIWQTEVPTSAPRLSICQTRHLSFPQRRGFTVVRPPKDKNCTYTHCLTLTCTVHYAGGWKAQISTFPLAWLRTFISLLICSWMQPW